MEKYLGVIILFSVQILSVQAQSTRFDFDTWPAGSTDITNTVGSCSMRTQVAGSLFQNSAPRYDDAGVTYSPSNGTGLALDHNWINKTTSTAVTLTFNPAILNPTFTLYDINRNNPCTAFCSSAWADQVTVQSNTGTLTATPQNATEQTVTNVNATTKTIIGNMICGSLNGYVTISISGTISTITITYTSGATVDRTTAASPNLCSAVGGETNCRNNRSACADPGRQYVTIGSVTGSNNCTTPLSAELDEFNVDCTENAIQLKWVTDSEQNNNYFKIERSSDGLNFELIKEVSASGSTNISSSYRVIDNRPLVGLSYYRLSQTDYDGSHTVLGTLSSEWPCTNLSYGIQLFPNPTDGDVNLLITHDYRENYSVEIYDAIGQLVIPIIDEKFEEQGETILKIKTSNLSAGIYLIKVVVKDKVYAEKLIIKK